MGVDYSSTVAYGIALEEMPAIISTDRWVEDFEVNKWLEDNGFEYIEFDMGGNWMSGEHIYLFALKGTIKRCDPMFDEGVISFDNPVIPHEAGYEFKRLCDILELPWPDSISWKLTFNVS